MKKLIFFLGLSTLSPVTGCKKNCGFKDIPECIQNTINSNKTNEEWGVAGIDEYSYKGMTVYAFVPDSNYSDAFTTIITSGCDTLCNLGGIAGITMCNGDKFTEKAIFRKKIWEK